MKSKHLFLSLAKPISTGITKHFNIPYKVVSLFGGVNHTEYPRMTISSHTVTMVGHQVKNGLIIGFVGLDRITIVSSVVPKHVYTIIYDIWSHT